LFCESCKCTLTAEHIFWTCTNYEMCYKHSHTYRLTFSLISTLKLGWPNVCSLVVLKVPLNPNRHLSLCRPVMVSTGSGIVHSQSPARAVVGYHQPVTASNVYQLDHLATFTATGSVPGQLLTAPEGVRRVREMALAGSLWPLRVHIIIGDCKLVVLDLQTGEEMEHFPLSLISDPTCAMAVDRRVSGCDVLDNLVLFTVLEDPVKKTSPPEMHVFQCVDRLVSDNTHHHIIIIIVQCIYSVPITYWT